MSSVISAVAPEEGRATSQQQARYDPVNADDVAQSRSSRRRHLRKGGVATVAAMATATAGAAVATHKGPSIGSSLAAVLGFAQEEWRCEALVGLRLDNGGGSFHDATVDTPDECAENCEARGSSCSQFVYSSTNGGCYMFGEATNRAFPNRDDDTADVSTYTSGFCGPAHDGLSREMLRQQVIAVKAQQAQQDQWKKWGAAEWKARQLVKDMDLDTKMSFVSGSDGGLGYAGFLKQKGLPGDIMPLKMQDGPQGFNPYQATLAGTATQFPSLLSLAATFDPEIAGDYAAAVADEFVTKGANVLLGPDVEVTRTVMTGRCYETLSGEDPFLGSEMVRPFVKKVQERGIISTVKHWLDNNQEIYRQTMTSEVRERAQHEIYMPVFKAAFDAGAAAVMCAYNKVNGHHVCENADLLKRLLRDELGFKGYVVSDWGATHDAEKSANNGLDVEMPNAKYYKDLPKLVKQGKVKDETIDDIVTHVLSAMHYVGQFDGVFPQEKAGALGHLPATTDGHRAVALKTIIDSAVLLKNEDATLPLATAGKKIALVGKYCNTFKDPNFAQGDVFAGGGSGFVITDRTITPRKGIQKFVKDAAEIVWGNTTSVAEGADIAVICAAAHAEEGWDRSDLVLPEAEDFVKKLRKQPGGDSQKIVVLAFVPGAVTTEWLEGADAAMMMFSPGEQVGLAVGQLLTGEASPAGRLPISIPTKDENRFTPYQYPGLCEHDKWCETMTANFSEDVLVGYRWNVAKKVPSAFPFGFGLTYTDFEFKDLKTVCYNGAATVSAKVVNTGDREGVAVPQVYVGFPSLAPVVNQLRGFQKVTVPAGGDKEVFFTLHKEDWSYFDESRGRWVSALEKDEVVTVNIGRSSAHLDLSADLSCLNHAMTEVHVLQ